MPHCDENLIYFCVSMADALRPLKKQTEARVVLMSATLRANVFVDYFESIAEEDRRRHREEGAPEVEQVARSGKQTAFYLAIKKQFMYLFFVEVSDFTPNFWTTLDQSVWNAPGMC